jgi:hypothetical protein
MRAGWLISLVGHIGAVLMTLPLWPVLHEERAAASIVVPIEVVAIAPEANVRALAPPQAEDVPEIATETVEETPPEPAPSDQPTPQRERQERFDLNAVARMADKQREPTRERADGAPSDRAQRVAGPGTAEVASLQARVVALTQRHMQRCWRMPADLPNPERLVVTVSWEVDRNGNLRGQPRVTSPRKYTFDAEMRVAAEAALRAVRVCEPYPYPNDPIVGEHFEIWRSGTFTFSVNNQ